MENLIKELRSTTSGNEKLAIMMKYKDNEQIKEAFRLCYDPFILSYIKKIEKQQVKNVAQFKDTFQIFLNLFNRLFSRQITGNEARNKVEEFLSQCKEDTQKIYIQILKKDMKCGVSTATLKKVWGKNFLKEFKVQLADKYEPEKEYDTEYWFMNNKLDGCRCIYLNNVLWTRSGNEIIGFEHIYEEVKDLCSRYNLDFVDGELFSKEIPFQTIQGYVLSYKNINEENKKKILYNIFVTGRNSFNNTEEMVEILKNVEWNRYKYIKSVYTWKIKNDPKEIFEATEKCVAHGYEGAMLRHPINWYSWKRDENLLKVKFFKEEDLKIIDLQEGTKGTKNEGKLGNFIVQGIVEGKKILSDVGTGISDIQREEIWQNKSKYIGKIIEVKYQNITDKPNENGFYSLRFPSLLKFKEIE